ncbi:(2Fe-2S)-binding protein [Candidatus Clostridium stratigraminis]|uniref:(2Fe-2S)-binding protein n=1 Tax=Candidatus Clostridium stratigraminis TaxID=3381661 RepID=A0ABW8T0U5_9CLOT
MKEKIHLYVNGDEVYAEIASNKTLLYLLREELGLTGTKEGCGAGECGACTVILNGKAVNSCLVMALEAAEGEVFTIEGEAKNGELSILQKSFIKHNGLQCGFCTPGMVMSARALLNKNPSPSKEEIIEAMQGNLCRCTGYESIIESVEAAAHGEAEIVNLYALDMKAKGE